MKPAVVFGRCQPVLQHVCPLTGYPCVFEHATCRLHCLGTSLTWNLFCFPELTFVSVLLLSVRPGVCDIKTGPSPVDMHILAAAIPLTGLSVSALPWLQGILPYFSCIKRWTFIKFSFSLANLRLTRKMSRILCQGASCPRGIYPGHACVSGNLQDGTKGWHKSERIEAKPPQRQTFMFTLCLPLSAWGSVCFWIYQTPHQQKTPNTWTW